MTATTSTTWRDALTPEAEVSEVSPLNCNGTTQVPPVLAENFSVLVIGFSLDRQIGHYVIDYYVPSVLLVVMSWISFWLHPSAVPGRTTLGE